MESLNSDLRGCLDLRHWDLNRILEDHNLASQKCPTNKQKCQGHPEASQFFGSEHVGSMMPKAQPKDLPH